MIEPSCAEEAALFALTSALHLLLLLALAALARRVLPRERVATREAWLKIALVGAPLGAAVQTWGLEAPLGGELVLLRAERGNASARAPLEPSAPLDAVVFLEEGAARPLEPAELAAPEELAAPDPAAPRAGMSRAEGGAEEPATLLASLAKLGWVPLAGAAWSAIASALLARHALRRRRLARALARRASLQHGEPRELLDALCLEAGVTRRIALSTSDALRVPVAFGWLRPEICVPASFVEALDAAAWEPLLAHELAHLVRRDPLWLTLCRAQAALLLGAPPLRWAERALRADAEWLADAWAARRTSPLELARCLAAVAERSLRLRAPRAVFALAGHDEPTLARRVERLLGATELQAERGARSARLLALAFGAALACGAPALRSAPRSERLEAAPVAERATGARAAIEAGSAAESATARATCEELHALERELEALREKLRGTSLEVELAPLCAAWGARVEALRAELAESSTASLPPSRSSNPSR